MGPEQRGNGGERGAEEIDDNAHHDHTAHATITPRSRQLGGRPRSPRGFWDPGAQETSDTLRKLQSIPIPVSRYFSPPEK